MVPDRIFQITLLISLLTHGIILFQNPNLNFFSPDKKVEKLEISYVKEFQKSNREALKTKAQPIKNEPFLKLSAKITADKKIPPPYLEKSEILKERKVTRLSDSGFTKPDFVKPDIIAVKKKIILPPVDLGKINNPTYISYYQIVREKIRRAAYQNYTRIETGEVYVSFIISNDGYLKEIKLIPEKSSPIPYLRETALKSIKEASPFPNFPKDLDYPQLSFNVVISFEIE